MGCHSDPHIVKLEDQFQEQSLSKEYLFCRHLTDVYSELPRLTFTFEMQDSLVCERVNASEEELDLYSSVSSANM